MVKIIISTSLAPETLAFVRQFGYDVHEIQPCEEICTAELIALNASDQLLVIFSDEITHYNIDDLVRLKLSHPGQIYCYQELSHASPQMVPKTYHNFPDAAESLTNDLPYNDAFFAQRIYFLPAKFLSEALMARSFLSMNWNLIPMPRYHGVFPPAGGKRVLFLDRDGVLNIDKTYVFKIDDCEIIPDIYPILEWGKENNFETAVLTNQSGIGRGIYTLEDVTIMHRWMAQHFEQKGLPIGTFELAPFHPEGTEGPFKQHSHLRKPYPGMALKVGERIPISLRHSFMIGDKISDVLWLPLLKSYIIQGRYDLGPDVLGCQNLREVLKNLKKDSSP